MPGNFVDQEERRTEKKIEKLLLSLIISQSQNVIFNKELAYFKRMFRVEPSTRKYWQTLRESIPSYAINNKEFLGYQYFVSIKKPQKQEIFG